jgi:hypothetical protein
MSATCSRASRLGGSSRGSFCGLKISIACQKRRMRTASPDMIITALVTAPDHPSCRDPAGADCLRI